MSIAITRTIQVLEEIVQVLPVGTNLALLQLMWAMANGSFLRSRGAVHGALAESSFTPGQVRRSWSALRYGVWSITELVGRWRAIVLREGRWQPREYGGYRPLAVDITAFWRPHLQGWVGKFFYRLANRAVKGVGFGVITQVGQVDGQRIPLLKRIIRVKRAEMSEADLKASILRQVATYLEEGEVWVHDAGVELAEAQAAGIPRYIIRLAVNVTGRRNCLPPPQRAGDDRLNMARKCARCRAGGSNARLKRPHRMSARDFHFKGARFRFKDGKSWYAPTRKWLMRLNPSPFGPFPTLCIRSQWFWARIWTHRRRRPFSFTLTGGLLSSRHWSPNRCWDCTANSFFPLPAFSDCQS